MTSRSLQRINAFQLHRWGYLSLVALPLAVSLLNRWGVHLSLWGCPLLQWIGVPCMGWGLTRSFQATARGDFAQAFDFHLFGPVLFVGFAIAALHWIIELYQGRSLQTFYRPWLQQRKFWLLGFLVIFGYHLARLALLSSSGQLSQWFKVSIVGSWF
jgi:Protein of unknown function (DUF2752)